MDTKLICTMVFWIMILNRPVFSKDDFGFVFLGDLHYSGVARTVPGYSTERSVEEIAKDIKDKGYQADFICHIGDLIENQRDGHPISLEEGMEQWNSALAHVKKTFNLPFFMCPGNHDWYGGDSWFGGKENIEKIFLPFISKELSRPLNRPFYSFRYGNSCFLFLNHLGFDYGWDIEQIEWLEKTLSVAGNNPDIKHIFIFGHPHLWNLAYFGFSEHHPLRKLISKHRVDAYFCGHSHRNTATVYKFGSGRNLLQVTGGPIGPKELIPTSDKFLLLNPPPSKRGYCRLYGGARSYFLVSVKGERVTVGCDIVGGRRVWEFSWVEPGRIKETISPEKPKEYDFKTDDLQNIVEAKLFLYAYTPEVMLQKSPGVPVLINGKQVGELPFSSDWEIFSGGHLLIPPELIRMKNEIIIQNPYKQVFGVRNCYLYLKLKDGKEVLSSLYPYVLFSLPDYKSLYLGWWLVHPGWGALNGTVEENVPSELAKTVELGKEISFNLNFISYKRNINK